MTVIIQRAASRAAVPWRNGKGVQYEVTADGPLPDGWSWRLSTADIPRDAPLSIIAGVNRPGTNYCLAGDAVGGAAALVAIVQGSVVAVSIVDSGEG